MVNHAEAIRQLRDELESVKHERDELEKQSRKEAISHVYDLEYANGKIESLQRDKAALIEVLEWYSEEDAYSPEYVLNEDSVEECWTAIPAEAISDRGNRARTILAKMKG